MFSANTKYKPKLQILALLCGAFFIGWIAVTISAQRIPGQQEKSDSKQQTKADTEKLPLGIVKEKPKSGIFVKTKYGYMVPYKQPIPGTKLAVEMIPIPGGTFKMGSPEDAEEKYEDEMPQVSVTVPPFWMAKTEITWGQFDPYLGLHDIFKEFQSAGVRKVTKKNKLDAITVASSLYDPSFTYDAGADKETPAATMTQYTARQYTKWLSLTTKTFYRLPLEAEWEYACRAGSTTAWHFGDDSDELEEYAWFEDNSDDERQKVGTKKPNKFGLYDMHGNVAEWVLDEYDKKWYAKLKEKMKDGKPIPVAKTFRKPTKLYPRVIRGGSWELDADSARCAFRMQSDDEEWKNEDPNFPASPWWYTTEPSTGVGFRLFRPLETPKTREAKEAYWQSALKETRELAEERIDSEGRGARGLVDPGLFKAIEEFQKKRKSSKGKRGR